MNSYLLDLTKGLINLIYPLICETCGVKMNQNNSTALCQDCLKRMTALIPPNPTRHKNVSIWAVCVYEGIAKKCIHLLKYKAKLGLLKPLSQLMVDFTNVYLKPNEFDIIMPVPLHISRLRERGFNQAELLAKRLAKSTDRPIYTKALKRIKPTLAQAGLTKYKRFTNLKDAFKINDNACIDNKNILLVDDIFTTGSTIGEAARILLKAKAKSVEALVLARGM